MTYKVYITVTTARLEQTVAEFYTQNRISTLNNLRTVTEENIPSAQQHRHSPAKQAIHPVLPAPPPFSAGAWLQSPIRVIKSGRHSIQA
jgi:hypothetical protein